MRYHDRFKSILFNGKVVHLSIKDEVEERMLEKEQVLIETQLEHESKKGHLNDMGLTMWEARKVNQ